MTAPNPPCPKCGSKNGWKGPRYVPTHYANHGGVALVVNDTLSYTCINCRFTRYEPPLDRRAAPPIMARESKYMTDAEYHSHTPWCRARWGGTCRCCSGMDPRPDTPTIPDFAESALNLADIFDQKEGNRI